MTITEQQWQDFADFLGRISSGQASEQDQAIYDCIAKDLERLMIKLAYIRGIEQGNEKEVARKYGIPKGVARRWAKQYEKEKEKLREEPVSEDPTTVTDEIVPATEANATTHNKGGIIAKIAKWGKSK